MALPTLTPGCHADHPEVTAAAPIDRITPASDTTGLPPDTTPPPPDTTPLPPDTTPLPPPPSDFATCADLPGDSVGATPRTLLALLRQAQPGQKIWMADGTYSSKTWSDRHGTEEQPIVLCGSRGAVIAGDLRAQNLSHWVFAGFRSQGAFQGIYLQNVDHSRLVNLQISGVKKEAIHFLCGSARNVVERDTITDTGNSTPSYHGEGVYIGSNAGKGPTGSICAGQIDQSDSNIVQHVHFGPDVPSEDVQVRQSTRGNIIRYNTSDGTGKSVVAGQYQASLSADNGSYDAQFIGNRMVPGAQQCGIPGCTTYGYGIYIYGGSGHLVDSNFVDVTGAGSGGYGIRVSGSGTVCKASNTVVNGKRSNVACLTP
ncbi:MAG TPA: hypothetical protein VG500_18935 [Gemmatimonadales bacterium]|nr:hypothetical protein [Gemmatimonadales bacterium]